MNVTEGVEASHTGVRYHCVASNMIGREGKTYTAGLRSGDITYTCK